jgi:hypothetical protein
MGMSMKVRRIAADECESLDSDAIRDRLRYGEDGVVDLDKAWDGISWLISEERRERPYMLPDPSDPETQAVYGIDPEGEGMLFRTPPERVASIADALRALDDAALRAHFDPARMTEADVYPTIWDEGEEALAYLLANFAELRALYLAAAAAGDAVIHVID